SHGAAFLEDGVCLRGQRRRVSQKFLITQKGSRLSARSPSSTPTSPVPLSLSLSERSKDGRHSRFAQTSGGWPSFCCLRTFVSPQTRLPQPLPVLKCWDSPRRVVGDFVVIFERVRARCD